MRYILDYVSDVLDCNDTTDKLQLFTLGLLIGLIADMATIMWILGR